MSVVIHNDTGEEEEARLLEKLNEPEDEEEDQLQHSEMKVPDNGDAPEEETSMSIHSLHAHPTKRSMNRVQAVGAEQEEGMRKETEEAVHKMTADGPLHQLQSIYKPTVQNENKDRKRIKKKLTWDNEVEVKEFVVNGKSGNRSRRTFAVEEKEEEEYFRNLYRNEETDEEFFQRIFKDWDLQDRLTYSSSSWISTVIVFPWLVMLRVVQAIVRTWLNVFVFLNTTFEPITRPLGLNNILPSEADANVYLAALGRFEDVTMSERKEAAAVLFFLMLAPLVTVAYSIAGFLLIFPPTSIPMFLYIIFILTDKTPENGKRIAFMRYWKVWRHFTAYFPIRLVKTANLDPNSKYVFCYHPHGIISFGAFGNFATDATGFSRLFPGINLRLLTLSMNFYVPWLREALLSMGVCSCSKSSCNNILSGPEGSSIMLVVGGADESLLASPGTYRLNVNGRKGFIRVAIDNGASLVPVLGFGENDAFSTQIFEKGSFVRSLQDDFKRRFGFATPIFWGRDGASSNGFGIMPHRTPIIAVVGKALPCPDVPPHLRGDKLRTTPEGRAIVNRYHDQYIKALKALYDAFKNRWAINRSESMKFVGHRQQM